MACGSIIEMTTSGEEYWIPEERIRDLTHDDPYSMIVFQEFIPIFGRVFDEITEIFKKNGPIGMGWGSGRHVTTKGRGGAKY
jgi:hypothetical protein